MKVDVVYLSHNRLEFTEASFMTLLENTNWDLVQRLFVFDDDSTDGTYEHLVFAIKYMHAPIGPRTWFTQGQFGGPVAVMNEYLVHSDADVLAKIDNDVIVCPGWLEAMLDVLERNDQIDVLGMEAGFATPFDPARYLAPPGKLLPHTFVPARWIGGVGLIRTRIFEHRRPEPNNRFFGWTRFQQDFCNCAWISPDLPMFLLDKMPIEPWRSLSDEYIRKGWQRRWPPYDAGMHAYWDWWQKEQAA